MHISPLECLAYVLLNVEIHRINLKILYKKFITRKLAFLSFIQMRYFIDRY